MINPRNAWYALTVLFAINAMNFYDRMIPGAIGELIRRDWDLNDTQLGALGTAFILLYATVGVPLGRLSDRMNRKKLLTVGVFVWSLLTAASGLARNFPQLAALRLAVGVGEATCAPAATSLIGDLFPARQRAFAMSLFMLGLPVGIAMCFLISGQAARNGRWEPAFFVALVPGLACAAAAWFISEPSRGASETHAVGSRQRAGSPYLVLLKTPTFRWIIVSGALHNFNMYVLGSFLISFLMRVHGCEITQANNLAMFVYGLSGIPGLLVGGLLGDRIGTGRGRMLAAALAIALAAPLVYLSLKQPAGTATTVATLMGIGCMLMYLYYSTVYPTIHDVVEPALRGTAMAIYFFAMYVLGGALGPIALGWLSDSYKNRALAEANVDFSGLTGDALKAAIAPYAAQGLHAALFVVPIIAAGLALVLAAGARTVTADAENLRRWIAESESDASESA